MAKEKKLQQKEREVQEMKTKMDEKSEEMKNHSKADQQTIKDKSEDLPKIGTMKEKKRMSIKKIDKSFITNLEH